MPRARSLRLAHSSTGHAHRQRRGQVGIASSHSGGGSGPARGWSWSSGARSWSCQEFLRPLPPRAQQQEPARERRAATSQQRSPPSLVCIPDLRAGQPRGSTVFGWDACRALGTARARARLHGRFLAWGDQGHPAYSCSFRACRLGCAPWGRRRG